ncbi:MFS polyamine transporter [Wolfiporia cocos MD-104 SS10]|uniref:MFS polyamine transporter n=1 Tax=Wolfiporia cocos (strain MD-104) TaxID=742152 RepID=A0A2H3JIX8_WOLCO|nr:MFS polyamine transporter [Wolfiporia cocos MD-104 SS10]
MSDGPQRGVESPSGFPGQEDPIGILVAQQKENRAKEYGEDNPHDPPTNSSTLSIHDEYDLNKVGWDGPDDPENPQTWSIAYKWILTALSFMMTINVTFASSAPSSAGLAIAEHFHKPTEYAYVVTTVFLCGYIIGPLFWGPGSELYGRQPMFRFTLVCYTILYLGQSLAPNMETLLVTRFLSGFFAVSPVTNCAGAIFDIWDPIMRGYALSLFTAGVFLGPVLGPIVGGFVTTSYLGWRWLFWVMMMFSGACTIIAVIFVPETYAPVLLQKKAKLTAFFYQARRLRKADPVANANKYAEHERADWSWRGILTRTLYRPLKMLCIEPILLLVTIYMSLVYGILYALFEAIPIIFVSKRGFTLGESGLIFIGVGIGSVIGAALFHPLSKHYPELLRRWRGFPPPEQRLFGAMIGGICLVVGCFWLGWAGEYRGVPWYVPALGTIPLGMSISMIFISFQAYLVDTYLGFTASAFAATTMVRSAVGAAFPLYTTQMYNKLGISWASTLLGLLGLLLAPSPFLFYRYGTIIRSKSNFATCPDLIIAEELKAENTPDNAGNLAKA